MTIKHFIILILWGGLQLAFANTQQNSNKGLYQLEEGINKWDIQKFKNSMIELKTQKSKETEYWKSVNLFYQSQYYLYGSNDIKNDSLGELILDSAIHHIENLSYDNEKKYEFKALLATLYGMNISVNFWSAFTNGSKIFSLMEEALKSDSANPRIQYLIGVSYLFTPSLLGGGTEEGRKYLTKAIELYKENKSALEINWGYSTSMGFMAQSWLIDENFNEAQKWIENCLALKSNDMVCLDAKEKLNTRKTK